VTHCGASAAGTLGIRVAIHRADSDDLCVTVSHVFIHPDDWNGLNEVPRNEYRASAAVHGVALTLGPGATTNPNQLLTVSDGDFTAIAAPYYFGPVQCDLARWEHNLRELLEMDDPCFPNHFRDQPGSIRTL
jgi:hypothetical protein